jgi:hypothetical protein
MESNTLYDFTLNCKEELKKILLNYKNIYTIKSNYVDNFIFYNCTIKKQKYKTKNLDIDKIKDIMNLNSFPVDELKLMILLFADFLVHDCGYRRSYRDLLIDDNENNLNYVIRTDNFKYLKNNYNGNITEDSIIYAISEDILNTYKFAELYRKSIRINRFRDVVIRNLSIENYEKLLDLQKENNIKTEKILTIEDNKFTIKSIDSQKLNEMLLDFQQKPIVNESDRFIKSLCLVKVKSFENSINIFGHGKIKKLMFYSNQNYRINNILHNHECKKDGIIRDVIEVMYEGRSYKFLYSDLEIITPIDIINKILKSYNFPKDRILKIGSHVKVINNKKIKVPLKFKGLVKDFIRTGNEKFAVLAENNNNNYNCIINVKKLKVI